MRSRIWQVVVLAAVVATGCSSDDGRDLAVSDAGGVSTPVPTATSSTTSTTSTTSSGSTDASSAGATQASGSTGPSSTESPSTGSPASDPDLVEPSGFDTRAATITTAAGAVCDVCLWLAATPELRRLGLMGVTDLGIGDGMVFHYSVPTSTSFWMQNTPMPLSIAFFDAAGAYMEAFDMEPCLAGTCPRYPTPADFLDAIEFPQGTLADFGIGPGSVLEISELPCEE